MESENRGAQYCVIKTGEKMMKSYGSIGDLFRLTVIVLMSAIGVIAFSESFLGELILHSVCAVLLWLVTTFPALSSLSNFIYPSTLSLLLAFLLCIGGARSIVVNRKGERGFLMLVTLFFLPSLLPYSIVFSRWLDYLSGGFLSVFLGTRLSYNDSFLLAMLLVIGYVSLWFTGTFKEVTNDLHRRGGDEDDVEKIFVKEHVYLFATMGGALLSLMTFIITSMDINVPLIGRLVNEPWGIMVVGLVSSSLILASAYYFITKMMPRSDEPEIIEVITVS